MDILNTYLIALDTAVGITFIISSKILYIHAMYACLNSEISWTKEK